MTRSLHEARAVVVRSDPELSWGMGVHPAVRAALDSYDPDEFRRLLHLFAIVGEVGLDKRARKNQQREVFEDILRACQDEPVLISIHSTGMTATVADLIEEQPHPGAILHWWLGTPSETERVISAGAYFSVNAAMGDERLAALPRNRVLPETDFPARSTYGRKPGHTAPLESRLARLWRTTEQEVRRQSWHNLRSAAVGSGALDRVGDTLADFLLIS